ncbi:hypothetical protein FRC00_003745, partial [Tulasnella sp. 408]
MSGYRIEQTRIKFADTVPRARGGQGVVIIGTLIPLGSSEERLPELKVAVKKLEWRHDEAEESAKFFKSFVNELSLMKDLSHPNIVKLVGFVEDMQKGEAWMILPWEGNGNVREFLLSGEWDIPERISLIQDTAEGLAYLHNHQPPICHGDLKSLNILVSSSCQAVITDFGSARVGRTMTSEEGENRAKLFRHTLVNDDTATDLASPKVEFNPSTSDLTLTGPKFSLRWTAPEVLDGGMQDLPSDMWAIGWVCWEVSELWFRKSLLTSGSHMLPHQIITGRIPFEELDKESAIIMHTMHGKLPATREDAQLSHVLRLCHLMSECWLSEPQKRIDASSFERKIRTMVSTLMKKCVIDSERIFFKPSERPSTHTSGPQKVRSVNLLVELGNMYEEQRDLATAEFHYGSALEVAAQTKDEAARADALLSFGNVYRIQSRNSEAEKAYMEARGISSRLSDDLRAAKALVGLGRVYQAQSKHHDAEMVLMEAKTIYHRYRHAYGIAAVFMCLGSIYCDRSKYEDGEKKLKKSYKIYSAVGDDSGIAAALIDLGGNYNLQSKHAAAEKAFMEAYQIYSSIGDDFSVGSILGALGITYHAQLRWVEAEKALVASCEIQSSIGYRRGLANTLNLLGSLYLTQSMYSQAEKVSRQGYEINSRIGHPLGMATSLKILAEMYATQLNHSEAEKAFTEAHKIESTIGNDLGAAATLVQLGRVRASQSNYDQAQEALIEADKIYSRIGKKEFAGGALYSLGCVYHDQGRYSDAKTSYHRALAAYNCGDDAGGRAKTLLVLGRTYHIESNYPEAEAVVTEALAILARITEEGQPAAWNLLAEILESQSKTDQEIDALIQTEAAAAKTGLYDFQAATLGMLGLHHLRRDAFIEAEEYFRRAHAIFLSIDHRIGEAAQMENLGTLFSIQLRNDEAEKCFHQMRTICASIMDDHGEARALEGLAGTYFAEFRTNDAKAAFKEACKVYKRMGRPV